MTFVLTKENVTCKS